MKNRKTIVAVMVITFSIIGNIPVFAGWQKDQKGWKYETNGSFSSDEWKNIDNRWYHFGQDSYMDIAWINYNEKKYYLDTDGAMLSGEKVISGKAYTFSQSGDLLREGVHRDGLEDDLLTEAVINTNLHWNDILNALNLVNIEREKIGTAALSIDYDLSVLATYRSAHMNKYNYFSHYNDNNFIADLNAKSYFNTQRYLNENIWLYGSTENPNTGFVKTETDDTLVQMAHTDYVNSSSHYQAMISKDVSQIGIGILKNSTSTRVYEIMLFN